MRRRSVRARWRLRPCARRSCQSSLGSPPPPCRFVRCGLLLARAACGHCRNERARRAPSGSQAELGREREPGRPRRVDEAELRRGGRPRLPPRPRRRGRRRGRPARRVRRRERRRRLGPGRRAARGAQGTHCLQGAPRSRRGRRPQCRAAGDPRGRLRSTPVPEGFQIEGEASSQRPERLAASATTAPPARSRSPRVQAARMPRGSRVGFERANPPVRLVRRREREGNHSRGGHQALRQRGGGQDPLARGRVFSLLGPSGCGKRRAFA